MKMYDVRSKMDDIFSQIKSRNRTASPAIVRTVVENVVTSHCLRKQAFGLAFADSSRQHVQTPGNNTCRLRRQQK